MTPATFGLGKERSKVPKRLASQALLRGKWLVKNLRYSRLEEVYFPSNQCSLTALEINGAAL